MKTNKQVSAAFWRHFPNRAKGGAMKTKMPKTIRQRKDAAWQEIGNKIERLERENLALREALQRIADCSTNVPAWDIARAALKGAA
ncbi:MAG: hypothetical protein ACREVW_01085 [Burkholderiales bacterium]